MFLGRERELTAVDTVLAEARSGSGGALLLEGEAGIGKSSLLGQVAPRAGQMRVLAAAGAEAETRLPFAGLTSLLAPLTLEIDDLPPLQAGALRAALAIEGEPGRAADPVATLQGTLALVSACGPVLVLVDDLHWLDTATLDAVCFLARRAADLPVAVLATRRPDGSPPPDGMEVITVEGLGHESSKRLLAGAGLAEEVAEQVAGAAAGNPLALSEIPRELSEAQRDGSAPIERPLPAGPSLAAVYAARVGDLPEPTRRALLLVAASELGDRDAMAGALEAAGTDLAALGPAEDVGLVTVDASGVRFRHPVARSAIYHDASGADRRSAHSALAATASDEAAAWHRAAAADRPDHSVAEALAAVAARSIQRGAPAAAADALERAAQVAPDGEARFGWWLGAAYAALVAGQVDRAGRMLDALLPTASGPLQRADVQRLRAGAIMLAGHPMESQHLLLSEVDRIEESDPGRSAAMLVDAGVAQMASGDMRGLAVLASRAAEAARRAGDDEPLLPAVTLAEALAVEGDHVRAREIVDGLELPGGTAGTSNTETLAVGGLCLMWLEDYERARAWLDRLIADARAAGMLRALPMPLSVRACVDIRSGNLARAESQAREAVSIAEISAPGFVLAFALSTLATVRAWTGDREGCRAAAHRALAIESELGLSGTRAFTELALATMELAERRTAEAAEHAIRGLESSRHYGTRDPSFLQDAPNLIEALVREGRGQEAAAALADLETGAELTGGTWPRAVVARCHGLIAPATDFDHHFEEALRLHDSGVGMPLERARTVLCHGERLRRARRRADARVALAAAERAFERAGAAAWADRARHELAATGLIRRPTQDPAAGAGVAGLTPRELEVCRLVADGAQNREVAAALFMSLRTVEYHLSNAYRKLEVRSRTELAASLLGATDA